MENFEIICSATAITGLACPKCASQSFRRHGRCLGIQRYHCKKCGRCFKETVNTPLHWIHNKQKMVNYAASLPVHLSIRKAAVEIGISVSTSFSWRHKLLSSFIDFRDTTGETPAGICSITVPYSYKGRRTIPQKLAPPSQALRAAGAKGIPCLLLLPNRCTSSKVAKIITSCLAPFAAISCRPAKILTHATRLTDFVHVQHTVLKKKLVAKTRSVLDQLEEWMERFHGVATKYLQQYWNWYRAEVWCTADAFKLECFARRNVLLYRSIRQG